VTAESFGGWSFPDLDALLERIKDVPERGDNDALKEWITAYLKIRLWMSFLRLYSDLSRHGGVEMDPATGLAKVVTYKPEDVVEAAKTGDVDQLRDALAQFHGDGVRPFVKHPKRGSGKQRRARRVDEAEDDYYFIRDLLERKYGEADGTRLYGWARDVTDIIADFHGVVPDSLRNRVSR